MTATTLQRRFYNARPGRVAQSWNRVTTRTPEVEDRKPEPLTSARSLISEGRLEPLSFVPFHANGVAPLSRRLLAGAGVHEAIGKHIVCHEIRDVPSERRSYCEPHVHDCDEVNILMSDSHLSYEVRIGDEVFVVNFADEAHVDVPFTNDALALAAGLRRRDSIGGTALRDAVAMGVEYLDTRASLDQKVLLVITDGVDTPSSLAVRFIDSPLT